MNDLTYWKREQAKPNETHHHHKHVRKKGFCKTYIRAHWLIEDPLLKIYETWRVAMFSSEWNFVFWGWNPHSKHKHPGELIILAAAGSWAFLRAPHVTLILHYMDRWMESPSVEASQNVVTPSLDRCVSSQRAVWMRSSEQFSKLYSPLQFMMLVNRILN
jgi:hypothetical protein